MIRWPTPAASSSPRCTASCTSLSECAQLSLVEAQEHQALLFAHAGTSHQPLLHAHDMLSNQGTGQQSVTHCNVPGTGAQHHAGA